MNRKTKRKFEKYIDLSLKFLPSAIAIFFVGSIAFNVAYFGSLNLNWYTFLSLPDYYEGSIFSILYLILICFVGFGLYITHTYGILLFKKLISHSRNIKLALRAWQRCLAKQWNWLCIRQKMRFLKNIPFDLKRIYLKNTKELKQLHREAFELVKIVFWRILKILFVLFLAGCWILAILYLVYIMNWPILIIIFFTYIQFMIIKKYHKHYSLIGFCCVLGMFYLMCMWNLGVHVSNKKYGYDILSIRKFINHPPTVARIGENDYLLVRGLSRGVVVQNDDEFLFFKWEDVKYLHQKRQKKNAKK